ncbi:GNAT family N-acetyltransferase [Paeniglutamicibacter antarcticus]|uniref:GNAT family N-acetyltransferase n=1 Tax=Arthrobacter terrae TaxID=2935737 RepID=A0A931CVK3_9MICC|nr:GNAT family N-acetyltransferase [Arthrobacter terrae]MBG0741751.1 GNAT family N-acetyltransferase [Arthrobacter terrae]
MSEKGGMAISPTAIEFHIMLPDIAREIADEWKYSPPYDFYNVDADPDDYREFIDPTLWSDFFYGAYVRGELIGFFQVDVSGTFPEISLGMRPDLTGNKLGRVFVDACIGRTVVDLGSERTLSLTVASFNKRAIRVYEAAGFVKIRSFVQATNGGSYPFVEMTTETHEEQK